MNIMSWVVFLASMLLYVKVRLIWTNVVTRLRVHQPYALSSFFFLLYLWCACLISLAPVIDVAVVLPRARARGRPEDLLKEHNALFWFHSPRLVFVCIQVMVMYVALALSGFLMFEISSTRHPPLCFLGRVLLAYAAMCDV